MDKINMKSIEEEKLVHELNGISKKAEKKEDSPEPSTEIKIKKPTEQDLVIEDFNTNESNLSQDDNKSIVITIVVIISLFALLIIGSNVYNSLTGAEIVDIDQLHQKNLEEELDEEEGYTYNGYSFVKVDGLWWTEVKRFNTLLKIPLHFGPKEVDQISFTGMVNSDFDEGNNIYVSIDPDVINKFYTLSLTELSFNMAKGINRNPTGACTKEDPVCDGLEILNCENSKGKPVIEFALSNETKITAKGTCIKISGDGYDLVKATNRLLYMWYGIIQ